MEVYQLRHTLGEGGAGTVRAAVLVRPEPALPLLISAKTSSYIIDATNELSVLETLRHDNIVILIGACKPSARKSIVLLGYMPTSLFDWMVKHSATLTDVLRRRLAAQLCHALVYIHSKNVVHRDVKPANILLAPDADFHLRLCDFGSALVLPGQDEAQYTCTLNYRPPELLLYAKAQGPHTTAIDIWSAACVFAGLFTGGRHLIPGHTLTQAVQKVLMLVPDTPSDYGLRLLQEHLPRTDLIPECPPPWDTLLRRCLMLDPARRPSAEDILAVITDEEA